MAQSLISLIGESLVALLAIAWSDVSPPLTRAALRLAEALQPDPPFELHADDGRAVTGLVFVERNRVRLFVGLHDLQPRPTTASQRHQAPDPRYGEHPFAEHERPYDDQLLWPRPYGR